MSHQKGIRRETAGTPAFREDRKVFNQEGNINPGILKKPSAGNINVDSSVDLRRIDTINDRADFGATFK